MEGFIRQVAGSLYNKYGDEISSLTVIFPSRRARLFFSEALSSIVEKPIWQPRFSTIDELMEGIAGIHSTDQIRLVAELYKVYSKFHGEDFDSFYFWGEMLLADFDSVDKYLIDARMLFTNISDIKAIESDLSYMTQEQRQVIASFWRNFGSQDSFSDEKKKFFDIWQTLLPIYNEFRQVLTDKNLAYTGMVYRSAAERIKSISDALTLEDIKIHRDQKFVFAGFNALSECEKILLSFLDRNYTVEFFWDYDNYYLKDIEQEAGLFLRDNVRRFEQRTETFKHHDNFSKRKNITVVEAPSDSLQCKYAKEFLEEVAQNGHIPGKETAIVLTDENLLVPLLHSIPHNIEKINITMGYPLKLSPEYTFVERLVELNSRARKTEDSHAFYHSDITGLLNHPFFRRNDEELMRKLQTEIVNRKQIYVDNKLVCGSGNNLLNYTFCTPIENWNELSDYLLNILSLVGSGGNDPDQEGFQLNRSNEFLHVISEYIRKLYNSLIECGIDISFKMYASLLRKLLQNSRVPYQGEPLEGLQVMGILETRNLDFKNVLILSANDDTFPGNRAAGSSFIPFNLRLAYGLPTPTHHEGVYAYYFYRLLQRADNIHIAYSSKSDERSTGEQSRYIYQLEYESAHNIKRHRISLNVNIADNKPISIQKTGTVASQLNEYLKLGEPLKLSPTAFFNYIACPLKFYFYSVAKLKIQDEIIEEIDAPVFGTILHKAMEKLYKPLLQNNATAELLKNKIGPGDVKKAVESAVQIIYLGGDHNQEYGGSLILVSNIVQKYINSCILPYDTAAGEFCIDALEKRVGCEYFFHVNGKAERICLTGLADRIDELTGDTLRVIDYKTGKENLEFKGVNALFSESIADQNPAALQTFLYAVMLDRMTNKDIQPAIYYVRSMNKGNYSPLLYDKSKDQYVKSFTPYKEEFESLFREKLSEIFDTSLPFVQCSDVKQCLWCDFNGICRRK